MKRVISLFLLLSIFSIYSVNVEASTYGVIESKTNRTLVPVRLVSEMFDVKVDWEPNTQSVILGETYRLSINSNIVVKDGLKFHEMNTKPRVIRGSVYVPARDIANILGVDIEWLGETSEVKFTNGTETYIVSAYWESMLSKEKVTYTNKDFTIQGKKINVNIVSINLLAENTSVHVELAQNTLGATDTLMNIAKSNHAITAINGNYFDAYTPGVNLRAVYNGLVMDGKNIQTFDLALPVFYYTKDGSAGILPGKEFLNKFDEGNVQEALQIGPTLVRTGQIWLYPKEEGFTEEKILTLSAARSAVGVLPNRQVVFLTTRSATVTQLAAIMKELGARDAMNFDGGASSGLFYNGKYITNPGRDIPVTLLVK